jgi:hypothetical protein
MSTRSNDERNISRTEARRRARLAARGEMPEQDPDDEPESDPQPRAASGGFLRRLFPPAPPLPNRPDPLKGFDPSGPMRPVRERIFLLRSNLLAWAPFGIVAVFGYFAFRYYQQGVLGLLGMFVLFGALIAAGWIGWQRPTLFGTAAGVLNFVIVTAVILNFFGSLGVGPDAFGSPAEVIVTLTVEGLYQAGLGFIGGWYGGYLRRRQAQLSADVRRTRR